VRLPKIPKPSLPRRSITDLVEVAGLGCLDGAAWWIHPILGLAVLGAMLLFVGWVADR
jgi:hypothetical protein